MKTSFSLPRVAFLALALGTAGVTATFAQTTTPNTTPEPTTAPAPTCTAGGGHHHRFGSVLTETERAQLKKDHEAVLAANGTFQTQEASLKHQREALKTAGTATTPAQWQAFHQQKETLHQQMRAAELAMDPSLAPIFAKLDAAHQNGHHHNNA